MTVSCSRNDSKSPPEQSDLAIHIAVTGAALDVLTQSVAHTTTGGVPTDFSPERSVALKLRYDDKPAFNFAPSAPDDHNISYKSDDGDFTDGESQVVTQYLIGFSLHGVPVALKIAGHEPIFSAFVRGCFVKNIKELKEAYRYQNEYQNDPTNLFAEKLGYGSVDYIGNSMVIADSYAFFVKTKESIPSYSVLTHAEGIQPFHGYGDKTVADFHILQHDGKPTRMIPAGSICRIAVGVSQRNDKRIFLTYAPMWVQGDMYVNSVCRIVSERGVELIDGFVQINRTLVATSTAASWWDKFEHPEHDSDSLPTSRGQLGHP